MRVVGKCIGTAVLLMLWPAFASAQTVIESPQGTMELIGLRRWTYVMLEDSLARYAPGESLRSHACQAILQQKLGFPSASVRFYTSFAAPGAVRPPRTWVITLVEPQDSSRVRWRPAPQSRHEAEPAWRDVVAAVATDERFDINQFLFHLNFAGVAQRYGADSARAQLLPFDSALAGRAPAFWRAITAHGASSDVTKVLATLELDANVTNRLVAVGLLTNFLDSDRTWHTLVALLRDPDERVRGAAATVLVSVAQTSPRKVDWTPAADDLRWLLGGTNTSAFTQVVSVLVRTEVNPALAPQLLAGNGALLLAHARAKLQQAHEPAWSLLRRLSGRDARGDVSIWEAWLRDL